MFRIDAYDERYARSGKPTTRDEIDYRTETERDRGRLSYSPYLRRLAGVTQVTSPDLTSTRMHSRASHTHKVASIAREIAEHVVRRAWDEPDTAAVIASAGGLDISACEAAGLAHDLGHPPFGHAGEAQLNRLLRSAGVLDGFEGNAQSFRIVTSLELRAVGVRGLDLTNVTLAAIQKYPYGRQPRKDKFGAYVTELDALEACRRAVMGDAWDSPQQSLEASVMDLADDIAYAVHDLEDFAGAGAIDIRFPIVAIEGLLLEMDGLEPGEAPRVIPDNPFSTQGAKLASEYAGLFDYALYETELENVQDLLISQFPDVTGVNSIEYVATVRKELSSLIGFFFASIVVLDEPYTVNGPRITLNPPAWHRLQVLKVITREYLVRSPKMGLIQQGQTAAITTLVNSLAAWLRSGPLEATIPPELLDFASEVALVGIPKRPKRLAGDAGEETPEEIAESYDDLPLAEEHWRAIVDYVCGMSDSEALLRSQWLSGTEIPGMSALGVPLS